MVQCQKNSEMVMKSQRRKKLKAVEEFGGCCQMCGYNKCINALSFHHLYDKKFSPSYIIMRHKWESTIEELKKCILLCSNCHAEVHFGQVDVSYLKFSESEWLNKECKHCSNSYTTREEDQKFCSSKCRYLGQSTKNKPARGELKVELDSKTPYLQLARKYKVTDNTVRKWAHEYGLAFFDWIEKQKPS